ncbi:hypothetical protein INS49_015054 [Diaporthe citri]|uniref:uncharacterized protein n=1 Tax=Diaporthe citri TaxID=83186 RepID=UPI001C7F0EFA|nr:uncharacterized protein INS49_015054 [Diaporthe citri]KAG6357176.1 hypothetical protein INS49_015054 [Diaporthe citri]
MSIANELEKLFDPENDETSFRPGHTAHHTLDTLPYPVDKPRNKSRSMTMQRPELALDKFWDELDKYVKKHCSEDCFDAWQSQWPRREDLKRTKDWGDAETAPLVGRLAAVNLNLGHEEKAPATEVARPSKKSKKKKRKAPVPESENIEDPRPNEAEDDTTQPKKPSISISKRAWQVFHDGLSFVPKEKKKPAELRWQDFLHAMTSLGFSATKMFGSVWRFDPGERHGLQGSEEPKAKLQPRELLDKCVESTTLPFLHVHLKSDRKPRRVSDWTKHSECRCSIGPGESIQRCVIEHEYRTGRIGDQQTTLVP